MPFPNNDTSWATLDQSLFFYDSSYTSRHRMSSFCFLDKFSVFKKFLQIFHVASVTKISVSKTQESAPASCTKQSVQKTFMFYKKNFRLPNFMAFYRKIFKAEDILNRIKPRFLHLGNFTNLIFLSGKTSYNCQ